MDPNEVEFLGEKQSVTIIPSFTFDQIHLISGSIGPFRAGLPTRVPIWLAVNLKQQQKCRIVSQEWMDAASLTAAKANEKENKFFTQMPSDHYMDEALMLLGVASEDIPQADDIRTVIKDIWDLRMSKLRTSVDAFVKTESTHAQLDHLTSMEINSIRPLLPHTLDQLVRIQSCSNRPGESQDSQQSQ